MGKRVVHESISKYVYERGILCMVGSLDIYIYIYIYMSDTQSSRQHDKR